AAPLPATTPGSRSPRHRRLRAPNQPGRWRPPGHGFGALDGTPPPPFLPDSLPSAAPPICSSFAANWRMLRAYRDRRPEPLPLRQGGTPWSLVPAPHRNPRPRRDRSPWLTALPASVPCHAGWTDGSVAQVHAASPAVRLPSRCHFAAPPRPRRSALLKGAP